jgi:hypothetical protein
MLVINQILNKYSITLLFKIIFFEIKHIISSRTFPKFYFKTKNNKFHPLIPTPIFFCEIIYKYFIFKRNYIFIDFGCGDAKIIKYLYQKKLFKHFYGYEINKKIMPKSGINFNKISLFEKNLYNFHVNEKIFSLLKNNSFICLYFYNPFCRTLIKKIINFFEKYKNKYIILLGFNLKDIFYLKTQCNLIIEKNYYNILYICKNNAKK